MCCCSLKVRINNLPFTFCQHRRWKKKKKYIVLSMFLRTLTLPALIGMPHGYAFLNQVYNIKSKSRNFGKRLVLFYHASLKTNLYDFAGWCPLQRKLFGHCSKAYQKTATFVLIISHYPRIVLSIFNIICNSWCLMRDNRTQSTMEFCKNSKQKYPLKFKYIGPGAVA